MTAGPPREPRISIVVPILNEAPNIRALYERVVRVMEGLGWFELIWVDDGSTDESVTEVLALQRSDVRVKLIKLSRNFGHQAAITAGLDHSRGAAVVILDGDLQDPPELIREFVARWRDGYDVVFGVRRVRREGPLKRLGYFLFYRVFRAIATIRIDVDAGDFCLMDRRVVDVICRLPEKKRFLRGLRSWAGFRQVGVEYDRPRRFRGEPKYKFVDLVGLAFNGIVNFSVAPLRLASAVGGALFCLAVLYLGYALAAKLLSSGAPPGWTSLVALIVLMGAVNLLLLGFQGEYLMQAVEELKGRPPYVIEALHDAEESSLDGDDARKPAPARTRS